MRLTRKHFLTGIAAAAFAPSQSLGASQPPSGDDFQAQTPVLHALARLIRSREVTARLVHQMPVLGPGAIGAVESRAAAKLAQSEHADPFNLVQALIADDFRNDRTSMAGGFVISETEAALAILRMRKGVSPRG